MHMALNRPKRVSPRVVIVTLLTIMVVAATLFVVVSVRQDDPQQLLAEMPEGSRIGKLGSVLRGGKVWGGYAVRWIPVLEANKGTATLTNEYGYFQKKSMGNLLHTDLNQLDNTFTGEVTYFVNRAFADSIAVTLIFVDGILRERHWGYMPG